MGTTTTAIGSAFTTLLNLTEASTGLANLATTYGTHLATVDTHSADHAVVYINYTKGAETSLQVKIEVSDDEGATYRSVPVVFSPTAAVLEFSKAATAKSRVVVPLGKIYHKMRVNVKLTGNSDTSTAVVVQAALVGNRQPIV